MAKTINYPTQEWLDSWVDKYLEEHPNEKVEDFKALEDEASAEWWDKEIDQGHPTPYDLTPEQQKVAKEACSVHQYKERKEPVKRERKADEEKRIIIAKLAETVRNEWKNADISNI